MPKLETALSATLAFETNLPVAPGEEAPKPFALTRSLVFSSDRRSVDASDFPDIDIGPFKKLFKIGPFKKLIDVTLTVSRYAEGVGTFDNGADHEQGRLEIPITLLFESTPPTPPSSLALTLTTETTASAALGDRDGQRLDPQKGTITLVGAGRFADGELEDTDCVITMTGTIVPNPLA